MKILFRIRVFSNCRLKSKKDIKLFQGEKVTLFLVNKERNQATGYLLNTNAIFQFYLQFICTDSGSSTGFFEVIITSKTLNNFPPHLSDNRRCQSETRTICKIE